MPRDGATGVYTRPPGTDAVSNATVSSKAYNANVADVEFDLNYPRPISAGGTGANNAADAAKNLGVVVNTSGQCRLVKSGANIVLKPYNGNTIIINGKVQTIPDAGVSLSPALLAQDVVYYVYAYMDLITPTLMKLEALIFASAPHSTQPGTGVEIKTGDATRSLVGMVKVVAGPAFVDSQTQRFVISWFNRGAVALYFPWTGVSSTTSGSFVNLGGLMEILCWETSSGAYSWWGGVFLPSVNAFTYTAIGMDGVLVTSQMPNEHLAAGNNKAPVTINFTFSKDTIGLSEGNHYFQLFGAVSTGTGSWGLAGVSRFPVSAMILSL